ncbi:MAG: hypothetical protein IPQ07_37445 [Myxococcales bacterium]|nr:hypothetical protein [Myxococcales bacterium]
MFRKGVRLVKKIVPAKMEKKIAKSSDKKMKKFSPIILGVRCSVCCFGFMPLGAREEVPGAGQEPRRVPALAAVTFVVTVNLFGGVLLRPAASCSGRVRAYSTRATRSPATF